MIDKDIDYCDQQIEAQIEKVQAVESARRHAEKEHQEADQRVREAQREKARIGHMISTLNSKFGVEKRILADMVEHRKQLKTLKKMMLNQHKMVPNDDDTVSV